MANKDMSDRAFLRLLETSDSPTYSNETTTNSQQGQSSLMKKSNHKEILQKDAQETLELDLSCAICQDIFINPILLNCSHSFCKFCIYSWLAKHKRCPQCRVPVCFQAENLALRNIIQKMIMKSSEEFQKTRRTNVEQRLKDEETQSKTERPEFLKNLDDKVSLIFALNDLPHYSHNDGDNNRTQVSNLYISYDDSSGPESPRILQYRELFQRVIEQSAYDSDTENEWAENDGEESGNRDIVIEDEGDEESGSEYDNPNDETFEPDEDEELSEEESNDDSNSGVLDTRSEISEHEALEESESEMEVQPRPNLNYNFHVDSDTDSCDWWNHSPSYSISDNSTQYERHSSPPSACVSPPWSSHTFSHFSSCDDSTIEYGTSDTE